MWPKFPIWSRLDAIRNSRPSFFNNPKSAAAISSVRAEGLLNYLEYVKSNKIMHFSYHDESQN